MKLVTIPNTKQLTHTSITGWKISGLVYREMRKRSGNLQTYMLISETHGLLDKSWEWNDRCVPATWMITLTCITFTDSWTVNDKCTKSVEIKCQLDATEVFIADLIACSTCFGHHYAHHQELRSIIQWLLPVVFRLLDQHPANWTHNPQLHTRPATWKTTAWNTTGSNHCIILLSPWWWA